MKSPKISVVICTYNRVDLLAHVLCSVAEQSVPPEQYEIIVIDNNSIDSTREFVERFNQSHSNVRYIYEPQQGLSHARNRGWQEAKGEYVAYIDDDARAQKDWIETIAAFTERQPAAVAFGGPYSWFSLKPLPSWFNPSYASWSLGTEERPVKRNEWLKGTNMIYKRSLLQSLNGFDTRLGMTGQSLSYGEEVSLQIQIMDRGFPIFYVPDIRVEHLVADYKLKMSWFLKSIFYRGYFSYEALGFQNRPLYHSMKVISDLAKGLIRFIISRQGNFQARFIDNFYHLIWQVGLTVRMFKG